MDPEHHQVFDSLLAPTAENLASVKVFPLIPSLKTDVTNAIDTVLSWEQLNASDVNFAVVRPLVAKYARLKNMAVVYACLVVRSYFIAQSDSNLAFAGVMRARANLCEILAMKLLSPFASNYLQLVAVLTTAWNPLAGATTEVVQEVSLVVGSKHDLETAQSTIEVAISTEAKAFLASPVAQSVVNDIYSGKVVFLQQATRSVLADNYKPRAIEIYDVRKAPFLDHYRLRVPRYSAVMEFLNFACLMSTFVLCLANQDKAKLTIWEMAFIIFASAFSLEEYSASTQHGWIIYIANMWNAFDFTFIVIFLIYLGLRIQGLRNEDLMASKTAFDVLACGACILFPRLAFFAVSKNVVILSLRAMIVQFVFFIGITAICFSGLFFTLWTLAGDEDHNHERWSFRSIAWLMVQVWFGNTYLSFTQASSFHPIFGPILMTIFAALSNTLLLTILISILSNTVARIDANATQEYLFQSAISTIEGVKSDALFSYQPPCNLLAFVILKPASWFLSPRALHSANVFLIKVTSLPQLLVIAIYERYLASGQKLHQSGRHATQSIYNSLPRHIKNMPLVEALVGSTSNDLYDAIFDVDVSDENELDICDDYVDEERLALGSDQSRESIALPSPGTREQNHHHRQDIKRTRSDTKISVNINTLPKVSPRLRVYSAVSPTPHLRTSIEGHASYAGTSSALLSTHFTPTRDKADSGLTSPLARLFSARTNVGGMSEQSIAELNVAVKRLEAMLGAYERVPTSKLREDIKELQEHQGRIENLLLTLTRGMHNDTL